MIGSKLKTSFFRKVHNLVQQAAELVDEYGYTKTFENKGISINDLIYKFQSG
jgi:hypothetical protein